jgi:hypothetical protein
VYLLVALWAIGLVQSARVNLATTGQQDIFAGVAQYRQLPQIPESARQAGFRTDLASNRATGRRCS